MASRNRLRKEVNKILVSQFKDWGLPADIDYKSYCGIVDKPVIPKAIQKSFYNWKTAVLSVKLSNPEVFEKKPAPKPAAAPKAAPAKPAPAPKPKAEPVEKES